MVTVVDMLLCVAATITPPQRRPSACGECMTDRPGGVWVRALSPEVSACHACERV